jgi:hypothetical protein
VRFKVYAVAAACLVLAGLVAFSTVAIRRHQQAARYGQAIADLREALIPITVLTSIPSQANDVIVSPLATELAAVKEDTRAAARFVATCVAIDLSGVPGD